MSVIQQDILLGVQYPRNLTIQSVTAKNLARQLTSLSDPGTEDIIPIGIAYHLSGKGEADFMCISLPNSTDILLVSLRKPKLRSIADFLCADEGSHPLASKLCLVGFGMPQVAIQISHATKLRVKGVDLSALFTNPGDPWSPSEFIAKKVENGVKQYAVQRLWMDNKASAKKNVALRAWLAAWYVNRKQFLFKLMTYIPPAPVTDAKRTSTMPSD
jgi:hypothetical protein